MNHTAATILNQRKDELRACLFSLAEVCPVEECNPETCPLHQLRKKKYPERLSWINDLSEEDLAFLAAYHEVCMKVNLTRSAAGKNQLNPGQSVRILGKPAEISSSR